MFNEEYIYVEDWAYWLYVLRMGEKIYYADFNTLCHRDGGISHSTYTPETIPKHVKQYHRDIINIYLKEIFPYLNRFTTKQKYKILNQFKNTLTSYASYNQELLIYFTDFNRERTKDKKLKYYWKIQTFKEIFILNVYQKIKYLFKYNYIVPITVILWFITNILFLNKLDINQNILIILYLINYFVLYNGVFILNNIFRRLLVYNKKILITFILWLITYFLIINYLSINQNLLLLFMVCLYIILYYFVFIIDNIGNLYKLKNMRRKENGK